MASGGNGRNDTVSEEDMYAIIRTGGKQYQVAPGARVRVEKLAGEIGETVELTEVLLVADGDKVTFGKPVVSGAKVTAKVVAQGRGDKMLVAKFRRRGGYFNRVGHRQSLTTLQIEKISA